MPNPVVVGLSDDAKSATALRDRLVAAGLDPAHLWVVSEDGKAGAGFADSGIRFIYAGDPESAIFADPGDIMTNLGGTTVPGLSGTDPLAGLQRVPLERILDDAGIPEAQADVLAEVISDKSALFLFQASPGTAAKARDVFTDAGLKNVRVYGV